MPHRLKSRGRLWVAILAAYVLVLQGLFGGLAAGAHAGVLHLDQSLALTLCAPGSDAAAAQADAGAAKSHADPSCCTAGCPMLTGAGPLAADFRVLVHRPVDLVAFDRRLDRPVGYLSTRSPGSPRAPPPSV